MTSEAGIVSPRRTKLHPPRIANDVISRPRLLARLNRLSTLSLIVAPAGYGKTTLVSTWLVQINLPSAWVSLDNEDSDPRTFLTVVITAIQTLFPEFGSDILRRLNVLNGRLLGDIPAMLSNELNSLEHEFVLVLDDYHLIHDAAVHELLVQLLTHPPLSLHLVISSRHDPPLPWNLRVRSLSCEIRARDLNFTYAETEEFLTKVWDRPVEAETAKALVEYSEGWCTSLRLAALNVRRQPDTSAWLTTVDGSRRNFADYFASEVIAYLPDSVRDFLVRASFLDTLNGALCDFVLDDSPPEGCGAAQLRQLESDGVFITALDNDGTWYRLHPLFRNTLRLRLQEIASSAELSILYERGVAWHEEHGLLEEAIRYALVGGQTANAAALVGRYRQQLLDAMDFQRLDYWLRQFSLPDIDAHVDLLLTKAWLLEWRVEIPDVRNCLNQIERLLESSTADPQSINEWQGEVAALYSLLHTYAGDSAAAILAGQRALELTARERFYVRSIAIGYASIGLYMAGEPALAAALITQAAADPWIPRSLAMVRGQQVRHFLHLHTADIATMSAEFPKLLQLATASDLKTNIAWAHYFWGCASYLQNRLSGANSHFCAVLSLVEHANSAAYTHSAIGLALTLQAQGASNEAAAVAEDLQKHLGEMQLGQMLRVANAFAAELAARQGRAEDALRWLARDGRNAPMDAMPLFYVPGLAPVRVLIAAGSDTSLADAQTWLTRVYDVALQTRSIHLQIQALALQAVVSEASGDRSDALATFEQALVLAEHGGVVRVFADLGLQLAPLLELVTPRAVSTDFLLLVRSAIETEINPDRNAGKTNGLAVYAVETEGNATVNGAELLQPASAPANGDDLRHLLTHREMDVLRLLDQRLTNKEIARHLGISTETVRQHTIRLFRKLHVENRRQAIVAARSLGFADNMK